MPDKSEDRLKLVARAEELGLKFPPNIGDTKLAERVGTAEAEAAQNSSDAPESRHVPPGEGGASEEAAGGSPAAENAQPAQTGSGEAGPAKQNNPAESGVAGGQSGPPAETPPSPGDPAVPHVLVLGPARGFPALIASCRAAS